MKRVAILIFIAILPGLIGGCDKKADDTATIQESPSPNASPSPSPSPTIGQPPVLPPITTSSGTLEIAGLIPSTPPSKVPLNKGRSDPFGLVPVKPVVTVDPTKIIPTQPSGGGGSAARATPVNPTKAPSTATGAKTSKTSSTSKVSQTPKITKNPASATSSGKNKPPSPIAKAPPPPPEPTEAQSVFVSGVVLLSSGPVAIIKTPDRNVERTVTPGSFIANGQVLVKAIYANSDDPVVILEQYGIEVAKKVGEAPVVANSEGTPPSEAPANSEQS